MQIPSYLTPPFPDNGTFLEARARRASAQALSKVPTKSMGLVFFGEREFPSALCLKPWKTEPLWTNFWSGSPAFDAAQSKPSRNMPPQASKNL